MGGAIGCVTFVEARQKGGAFPLSKTWIRAYTVLYICIYIYSTV